MSSLVPGICHTLQARYYQSHEKATVGEQEYRDDARRIWPFSGDRPDKRLRLSIAACAREPSGYLESDHAEDS